MLDQGKAVLWDKDDDAPRVPVPGTTAVGWMDSDGYILLNPVAAYQAVHEYCQRSGDPFTFKADAVWKDLKREEVSVCFDGRTKSRARVYGSLKWVIKINKGGLL